MGEDGRQVEKSVVEKKKECCRRPVGEPSPTGPEEGTVLLDWKRKRWKRITEGGGK